MREIKFRAWHKKQKKMVIVLAITFSTNYLHYAYDNTWNLKYGKSYWSDISNFEIMQFTGLYDIHGKEIYEGDIVRYKVATGVDRQEKRFDYKIGFVEFRDGAFYPRPLEDTCGDIWYDFYVWDLEVIGNIYENPELLEGAK